MREREGPRGGGPSLVLGNRRTYLFFLSFLTFGRSSFQPPRPCVAA
jgi:hypothetical protein